jgi:hypothetical protein
MNESVVLAIATSLDCELCSSTDELMQHAAHLVASRASSLPQPPSFFSPLLIYLADHASSQNAPSVSKLHSNRVIVVPNPFHSTSACRLHMQHLTETAPL